MSDLEQPQQLKEPPPQPLLPAPDRDTPQSPPTEPMSPSQPTGRGRPGGRLLGLGLRVGGPLRRLWAPPARRSTKAEKEQYRRDHGDGGGPLGEQRGGGEAGQKRSCGGGPHPTAYRNRNG